MSLGLPTRRFRRRFLLLMLLSLLPASAVLLLGSNELRLETIEASRESARRYVRLARMELQQEINAMRDLLTAVSLSEAVREGRREECETLLGRLSQGHAGVLNIGLVRLDGTLICSVLPRSEDINLSDRDYFRDALEQDDLVSSRYYVGRLTREGSVAFARPVLDDLGFAEGVVFVSTRFRGLSDIASVLTLGASDLLLVLDAGGTVVGRFPDDAGWRGRDASQHPMVRQILRDGSGEQDFESLDGEPRHFVFDVISVGNRPAFYIAVGIDERPIAASALRILHFGLLAAVLVAGAAIAILWFGAGRVISRKLDAIVDATDRLASGDGAARVPVVHPSSRGEDEFDVIARAFNAMAASLAQRERDWHEALEQVEAGSQRMTSILDSLSARILVLDHGGRVVARNAAWGAAGETLQVGVDYLALLRAAPELDVASAEALCASIGGLLQTPAGVVPEIVEYARTESSGLRWYEMRATPLRGGGGGVVVAHEDITQRKALELRLAELVAELERSNRELQDFAYVASHDLQEPLRKVTAFAGRIESLYAERLDERGLDYLARMTDAARRMQQLIDALLTMSRVTTRSEPMRRLKLDEIAAEVLADLEEGIAASAARVEVGPLPEAVADPTQMRQLLQNLIGNAIKFHAPEASPQVTVSAEAATPGWVAFSVCDRGVGFAPGDAERIFAPFVRLHGRGEFDGTGLGLAVVKRIVERHRGRIVAISREGGGACFRVELPVPDTPAAA